MINITKYENILNQGLLLDHYSILCSIRDGVELPKSKRIQGFINLLHKKGYLSEGSLTEAAKLLIDGDTVITSSTTPITTVTESKSDEDIENDFLKWAKALHGKVQALLMEKTGKRQARGIIQGTTYCFLPNVNDLTKVLLKVIVTYKLKDFAKIEKCIMRYVEKKIKEKNWFPILGYYIMKNGMSTMVTDMEAMEEDDDKHIDDDSSINI